jgi:hypothetical protein
VFACMRWFARQPYSVAVPTFKGPPFDPAAPAIHFVFELLGVALCLLLALVPILVAWLPDARKLNSAGLLRVGIITLLWGLFERLTQWTMPWLPDVIYAQFPAQKIDLLLNPSHTILPMILPMWAREAISLLVIATTLVLVEYAWGQLRLLVRNKTLRVASWREMLWLLGPFGLSYFLLLMPVAYRAVVFDRYALFIMPIAIIVLLRLHQDWVAPTLPAVSVAVLAIFAVLGVTGTHDWFAWSRARLIALNEIRASGVPRTEIQGGFEYDGWTQTEATGYINNPWVEVPAGAYHPDTDPRNVPDDCKYKFDSYTPAIHPKYTILFPPIWCLEPSNYPPVSYRTWLPPFTGTIYVQKVPERDN